MRYFLFFVISALFNSWHAQASDYYMSPTDSIGIKIVNNRTYILHKVGPSESLEVIANRYGVAANEIKNANRDMGASPTVGAIILVPMARRNYAETAMSESGMIKRIYTVKAGDYLYKIARDFDMDVKKLKELNELESEVLTAGQQLIVEIPTEALQQNNVQSNNNANMANSNNNSVNTNMANQQATNNNTDPLVNTQNANASMNPASQLTRVPKIYKVQEGEYLFSLGRNLNVNLDSVRIWNYMAPADNVSLNQDVIVGYNYFDPMGKLVLSTGADIADVNGFQSSSVDAGKSDLGNQGTTTLSTLTPEVQLNNIPTSTTEEGIAMRITGNSSSTNQIVGLHKTAPYGTYIKVTNPSNGRTTAVKVIGAIPENAVPNDNVIIMLSPAACQRIGAINNQFLVKLSYNK
mgnify:CR=1 FL=1